MPTTVESYSLPTPPEGLVIVVDGSGGYQIAPKAVGMAVEAAKLPLFVRSFDWTHGTGRGLADMIDTEHARQEGQRLAYDVEWYRTNYPNLPVYLVGHSAGGNIVLEATRSLRHGRVERIVLLAPAVSAGYDLRQAIGVKPVGASTSSPASATPSFSGSEHDSSALPTASAASRPRARSASFRLPVMAIAYGNIRGTRRWPRAATSAAIPIR